MHSNDSRRDGRSSCISIRFLPVLLLALSFFATYGQTYENQYRLPLDSVLRIIESRFRVDLKYGNDLVKDRMVTYSRWRFRPDLEATLAAVLSPHDLLFRKVSDSTYQLGGYHYWEKSVDEGRQELDSLLAWYPTLAAWEKRKAELRQCMLATLGIANLPKWPSSAPIYTPARKMKGYSVQNVAIETMPGLYVAGSIYRPLGKKGKLPVILSPNGHFAGGRYRPEMQYRCASLAKMGAIVFNYDLFGWGESRLQVREEDHQTSTAQLVQVLNNFRIIDYLATLKDADTSRMAISGASGGGSQTMLITALSDRIKVSVPVVMVSSYFAGGCPCETGIPIHFCGNGTNNVEIAAMAAPRPQLVQSDGQDWTDHVPETEYPFLQKIYGYYGKTGLVKNTHFPTEGHDYGFSKRKAAYAFLAEHLHLDPKKITNSRGQIDESGCTIEDEAALLVFGKDGAGLPANALHGLEAVRQVLATIPRH